MKMATKQKRGLDLSIADGKMQMIFLQPALLPGGGLWRACANIVKPARVKPLAAMDTDNNS